MGLSIPSGPLQLGRRGGLQIKASTAAAANVDPSAYGTVYDHWRADTLAGSDGSALSSVASVIGSGRNLVQATGANQPVLKTGIQNGKNVIRFDGAAVNPDYLDASGVSIAQTNYIFAVFVPRKISADQYYLSGTSSLQALVLIGSDNKLYSYAGAFLTNSVVNAVGTAILVTFKGASGSSQIKVNGTTVTGNAGANSLAGLRVGAKQDGTTGGQVDLCELILMSAVTDQAGLENALKTKWGTP